MEFQEFMLSAEVRKLAVKLQQQGFDQMTIDESGDNEAQEKWFQENPLSSFVDQAYNDIMVVHAQLKKAGHFKTAIQKML